MKDEIINDFNKGDRVLIDKSSAYYGESPSNPANMEGTIVSSAKYRIIVRWDNYHENSYGRRDLVHAIKIIEDDGEY